MKIYDVLRNYHRFNKYDGALGVEIETESLTPYDYPKMKFWNTIPDGSLRHYGVEYVLSQPMNIGRDLDAALDEFETKTNKFNFIQDSVSTSVHVHINFLNETFLTLANFLTVYSLMENLLIRFSGPDRLSNLFCLPMCDAEDIVENIVTLLYNLDDKESFRGIQVLNVDRMKYSALNIASLSQRGSLESRSMRGVTDPETIRNWASILYRMLEYSRREGMTPLDIITEWKDSGIEMLENVFGDKHRLLDFPDKNDLVQNNLWYAAKIANFHQNREGWVKFAQFEKPKSKGKSKKDIAAELDQIALQELGMHWDALNEVQRVLVRENRDRQAIPVQEAEAPVVHNPNWLEELRADFNHLRQRNVPAEQPVLEPGAIHWVGINEEVELEDFNNDEDEEG